MARIAFLLLAHKDPQAVIRQAQSLVSAGDCVTIHYDARAPRSEFAQIRAALGGHASVALVRRRKRCGWGGWSLVAATLEAARVALERFSHATHLYLISGDCMAIKSAEYAHEVLDRRDCDYIESVDFYRSGWIKTGWQDERLIYRHWFNERRQRGLFYAAYAVQKRLGLTRRPPEGLEMMIGSQWWCLRRRTVEAVLQFTRRRRDVMRFFRSTWIPDETFFQTVVRHIVPGHEIDSRTQTFLMFSDYGLPVTFYNDHYDLLLAQDYLFARKISPEAHDLRRRLGVLYAAQGVRIRLSDEGRRLFAFLTEKGREGRRFAPRFWEATEPPERELVVILCKKWQVARRLLPPLEAQTGWPGLGYLFNEEACPLPDLGGIETSLTKRHRHRRALISMLHEAFDSPRLALCIDPANLDLVQDLAGRGARLRVLEIQCRFDDAYLKGHAQRTGLAGPHTPPEALERLLPTLRTEIAHESQSLRDAGLPALSVLREADPEDRRAAALSEAFGVPLAQATAVLTAVPDLFAD